MSHLQATESMETFEFPLLWISVLKLEYENAEYI